MVKEIFTELGKMAWDVYWPLALGFLLSAFVRAFVSTSTISGKLGRTNAKSILLASFFGAVSSSCSYAAASMSRTLKIKGASWVNSIVFMIASTNLVFEIFLVIVTLLGWAFFGGEIVGGILFIVIGAFLIQWLIGANSREQAKKHIEKSEKNINDSNGHAHHAAMSMTHHEHHHHPHHQSSGLNKAAAFFYMDVSMVGKDILLGVVIAAVLAATVPTAWWSALFLKNDHQLPVFISSLWNASVGILIAIFSFVCSVGNILLASVLWHGGISFGGVIAFILSDLVTIPMLMVYRKYYGTRMMWRLLLLLSLSILITALAVEFIFKATDLVPHEHLQQATIQMQAIEWNYKAVLNLIFVPVSFFFFFKGSKLPKKSEAHN